MVIKQGEQLLATDIQNLTFFPKGTILMYDGKLWDRSGGIPGWHICDGKNGTINLTDKFIRGSATARTTGGADTVTVPVPQHTHTITQNAHNHTQNAHTHIQASHTHIQDEHTHSYTTGVLSNNMYGGNNSVMRHPGTYTTGSTTAINQSTTAKNQNFTATNIAANANITINNAGTARASIDNRPAFCTLIFIEKITAYLA